MDIFISLNTKFLFLIFIVFQTNNSIMPPKSYSLGKIDMEKLKKGEWVCIDIENWGNCMKCNEKSMMLDMFYCMDCAATIYPLCLDDDADLYDDPQFQFWKCSICEEKDKNNKLKNGEESSKNNNEKSN